MSELPFGSSFFEAFPSLSVARPVMSRRDDTAEPHPFQALRRCIPRQPHRRHPSGQ